MGEIAVDQQKVYTIDDIARELGISKTTVSRAISGKGRLSAETRTRVQDFIREHNYRPNAVAKSLAQSRTNNIGLILPESMGTPYSFFQECTRGVCQLASEHDYDVLFAMDGGRSMEQMRRIIDNHKVDGIIASRSEVDSPIISLLKDQRLPFVIIGSSSDEGVTCVDNNNQDACRDLVSLLIARGVRKLALLGGDENHCVTHSRLRGYQEACRQAGLSEQLAILNLTSGAKVAAALERVTAQGTECVFCMDEFICNLALLQLRDRGIAVPRDMKLACFYDSTLLAHTAPPVTSLRFDAEELGRAACQELFHLLEGQEAKSHILPGYQMILRDSTK